MPQNSAPLLIKRYASRRLYNTETSDYVTLDDIAGFIRAGREVQVIDLKTGDDLTRQYLLQIITEHESNGENVLPINVLTDLVRSYTDQAQSFVPDFLSQSFDMLKKQQADLVGNIQTAIPDPMAAFGGLEGWQQKQQEFMSAMMGNWSPKQAPITPQETDDLDAIKRQLAELQAKLDGL
ncbi:MAG: polyhydroxyalkanoate synthesis repressor PhaR [Alphaproteobacteria bacterium]|nr:polyhydroxyalkanoate synthesis repressor PhaR [Alphaproteobacteria bacterium]